MVLNFCLFILKILSELKYNYNTNSIVFQNKSEQFLQSPKVTQMDSENMQELSLESENCRTSNSISKKKSQNENIRNALFLGNHIFLLLMKNL